jgi:Leucine-rich repeat (LRR) protein
MISSKKFHTLKTHYFTPNEASIPPYKPTNVIHHPIQIGSDGKLLIENNKTETVKVELDGFYLLETTGQGFPEDVFQACLSDRNIVSVVADDLTFFIGLLFLDISENYVDMHPFGAIPNLIELRIAGNHISQISNLLGFEKLMYLDLSYNKLSINSIESLYILENLKELDLCGNNIRSLPENMNNFINLEKIMLEYNKIEDNNVFVLLSKMTSLRQIFIANNFLSNIPIIACIENGLRFIFFFFNYHYHF